LKSRVNWVQIVSTDFNVVLKDFHTVYLGEVGLGKGIYPIPDDSAFHSFV